MSQEEWEGTFLEQIEELSASEHDGESEDAHARESEHDNKASGTAPNVVEDIPVVSSCDRTHNIRTQRSLVSLCHHHIDQKADIPSLCQLYLAQNHA